MCAVLLFFTRLLLATTNRTTPRNALEILAKEEDVPENYVLSSSVRPTRYTLELIPIVELAERGQDVIQGFLTVEFVQNADKAVSQLVLNAKHLSIRSHRLFVYGLESNATNVNASSTQVVRSKRDSSAAASDLDSAATSDSSEQSHAEPDVIVKNEVKIASNKTDESGGVYVIVTENNLVRGNYSLEIEYETTVDDRVVFVKNFTKNGIDKDDDMATDTFAATSPMSAYNLAFVDGDLENLDELAPNVSHWSINKPATDFYLRDKVGPVFEVYNELLQGVARPIDKLDIAALPVDTDGLSAPGLIVMRRHMSADSDGFLRALARNATIPADGKDEVDMPLDRAFATWVRQPGYPLINVTWHRHNGTVDIHQFAGARSRDDLLHRSAARWPRRINLSHGKICRRKRQGGEGSISLSTRLLPESLDFTKVRDENTSFYSISCDIFTRCILLSRVLNEILENNKYEDDDIKVILKSYAKNPAAAQAARRFLQENWKEIVGRYILCNCFLGYI
ncbi:unnamed protein product [Trichogramma brassicae]|uniref:Uncharacterized protein n=1 Tax=Trichogramma brassicae TaxID=86971 RepID=A0A6H5IGW5_9HYME|nr:unnamed protein product [Trichogramma brassicae]